MAPIYLASVFEVMNRMPLPASIETAEFEVKSRLQTVALKGRPIGNMLLLIVSLVISALLVGTVVLAFGALKSQPLLVRLIGTVKPKARGEVLLASAMARARPIASL